LEKKQKAPGKYHTTLVMTLKENRVTIGLTKENNFITLVTGAHSIENNLITLPINFYEN